MMKCDWRDITEKAYLSLLELNIDSFPIPIDAIKYNGVIICSYQEYEEKAKCSISKILSSCELEDAFLVDGLRKNLKLILYNNEKYSKRVKHTMWHEIGHLKLKHTKHGDKEEIEAHFFAGQANAPNAIINELSKRGYVISEELLMNTFGLSRESANKKLKYIREHDFKHTTEYDDMLLQKFDDYITKFYPIVNDSYNDEYFDELEDERADWTF